MFADIPDIISEKVSGLLQKDDNVRAVCQQIGKARRPFVGKESKFINKATKVIKKKTAFG